MCDSKQLVNRTLSIQAVLVYVFTSIFVLLVPGSNSPAQTNDTAPMDTSIVPSTVDSQPDKPDEESRRAALVIESDTTRYTITRGVDLMIHAEGAGRMRVGNDPDLTDLPWESFSDHIYWQLPTGPGTKHVYAQVMYGIGDASAVFSDSIEPAPMQASIVINNNAETTNTRQVNLEIMAYGATEMRVENSMPEREDDQSWIPFRRSLAWELPPGTGMKAVRVHLRNAFLIEETVEDSILAVADKIQPTITINDGAEETTSRTVHLSLTAVNGHQMQLSNQEPPSGDRWIRYREEVGRWTLPAGEGTKRVYMRVRDEFHNEVTVYDEIEPAPLRASVTINEDEEETPRRRVDLQLNAEGATEMQLANDDIPIGDDWIRYRSIYDNWKLSTGEGVKTVYLRVRNEFLMEEIVSDSILATSLHPTIEIAGGAERTASRVVGLDLAAKGAVDMRLANQEPVFKGEWQPFTEFIPEWELAPGPGPKIVYVAVRDEFLIETIARAEIHTIPLNPSLTILPARKQYTSDREVRL
ncbi:hypothetical protein GF324_11920, partial [bacterium]|nr:hypothetical protein [bacterium]